MTTVFLRLGRLRLNHRPEMEVERVSYALMTPWTEWATENHVIPAFLEMVFDQAQPMWAN